MNDLLLRFLGGWPGRAAAWLMAALLVACAPGTGGTGTGPNQGVAPGNAASQFEGNWAQGVAQASFDAKGIQARQGCVAVEFSGSWSAVNSEVRVPVEVQSSAAGIAPPASSTATTLTATTTPEGTLRLVVSDSQGQTLIGPVELKRKEDGGSAGSELAPGC